MFTFHRKYTQALLSQPDRFKKCRRLKGEKNKTAKATKMKIIHFK